MRFPRIHWPSVLITVAVMYFVLPWVLSALASRKASK